MPGPPDDVHDVPCFLSQRSTTNVSSASEIEGNSSFTTSLGNALFPTGTPLWAKVEVVDVHGEIGDAGSVWRVEGKPAARRPFVAAALLYVSDLQEG
jgi:hypothetical protein